MTPRKEYKNSIRSKEKIQDAVFALLKENKGMKTYIVVQEFSEPEKEPKIIAQFNERWQAEHYAWHHEGRLWVYEMSK